MSLQQKQYREPDVLELETDRFQRYISQLRESLQEMVDKGEGCAACGNEGRTGCGCRYERARLVLSDPENLYFHA
jgi:hypothetical protein